MFLRSLMPKVLRAARALVERPAANPEQAHAAFPPSEAPMGPVTVPGPVSPEATRGVGRATFVAHRGYSAIAPENTLASVREAIRAGAKMVEGDVWRTKDGQVVVSHDPDLGFITQKKVKTPIERLTLAEVQSHDAGGWKAPQYAGERIPTLAAVLSETVAADVQYIIEMKRPGIEPDVVATVRAAGAEDRHVEFFGWDRATLSEARRLAPGVKRTFLFDSETERYDRNKLIADAKACGAEGIGIHHTLIDPALVALVHGQDLELSAWTVNDAARMRDLERWGVDRIITDQVGVAREVGLLPQLDAVQRNKKRSSASL